MSTVKANAVTGATTNSNLALTGNGTGVVTIGDGNLAFPDADGNAAAVIGTNGSAQLSFLDAIASTSSNTNLSLSGNGTGGVKVSDYFVQTKGADIASATALTLGKDGNFFDVTGTTTITSIGTQGIGSNIILHFDGALTFTHHATDLILPGGANITTAAGDIAVMYEYASGDWRCVNYTKASGESVITTIGGTGAALQGLQTAYIPAKAMRPTSSNGCAAITDVETTSGRPDLQVLDFDASSDEHAQFDVAFPKSWNAGTITFRVFWVSTATDTDGVSWALQGLSVPDNTTIDAVYGTAIVVDDANQGAVEEMLVTATSSAVTIASAAADCLTFFRIFRDVSDANDTAAEDARLIGVQIFFTTNAGNDA